jgi:tetratricopeptide (TPR) repeat protein
LAIESSFGYLPAMREVSDAAAIDSLWDYSNPGASEERFRAALATAQGDLRLELLTQVARTMSLRRRFDEAHALLDEVDSELENAGPGPRVRALLERGRTFNSSGEKEKARALFVEAWERAHPAGREGLAVDAAHMAAITLSGTAEAIEWNQRGLVLARASSDPKARSLIPALLNNSAWDLHGMGRLDEALERFREAETESIARNDPSRIRVAKWAVARCLRSLARHDEALAIQRALEAEHRAAGTSDGFVLEEIAENLAAMGRADEARVYFGGAAEELGKDAWFAKHEAARLAHLKASAGIP